MNWVLVTPLLSLEAIRSYPPTAQPILHPTASTSPCSHSSWLPSSLATKPQVCQTPSESIRPLVTSAGALVTPAGTLVTSAGLPPTRLLLARRLELHWMLLKHTVRSDPRAFAHALPAAGSSCPRVYHGPFLPFTRVSAETSFLQRGLPHQFV